MKCHLTKSKDKGVFAFGLNGHMIYDERYKWK